MSVSTEVQRTLVKSPPELWSELSNPEALARHLAKLGEIRITSVEPETKVEWEAEGATGVVHLKQSGWGTKVTLSVTRIPPAPEEESEPLAEPEHVVELESELDAEAAEAGPEHVAETESQPVAEVDPEPLWEVEPQLRPPAEPAAELEPEPLIELAPQLGFFARLFRRRWTKPAEAVDAEPEQEPIAEVEVEPQPEFEALAAPEPIYLPQPTKAAVDLAAELASVEAQMTEETTELLTGVLDRLGAAHHRPFSRG